jgi:hypothetical protein
MIETESVSSVLGFQILACGPKEIYMGALSGQSDKTPKPRVLLRSGSEGQISTDKYARVWKSYWAHFAAAIHLSK